MLVGVLKNTLILLGTIRDGGLSWYDYYDDRDLSRFTEFQLAAFELKLSNFFIRGRLSFGSLNRFENNTFVLLERHTDINNDLVAGIAFFNQPPSNIETLQHAVQEVLSRGVPYFAKKFVSEMQEVITQTSNNIAQREVVKSNPIELLKTTSIEELEPESIGHLIRTALREDIGTADLPLLISIAHKLLQILTPDIDVDIPLDSCYFLADYLHIREIELESSIDLFLLIAETIDRLKRSDRFGLKIKSLLSIARIVHNYFPQKFTLLQECIERIDDGDLQLVGRSEWEQYYVYRGHVDWKMGDSKSAFSAYEIAVELSEDSPDPTFEVSEAYIALAENSAQLMKLDTAVQQALAAWSIAQRYEQKEFAQKCLDNSARYELTWAEWLSYAGLLRRMENQTREAVYSAWRSLKLILTAYAHGSAQVREGISIAFPSIFKNIQLLILEYYEGETGRNAEIARKIVADVNSSFALFLTGTVWEEEMISRLEFLRAQISSLLPRQIPTFLLIANDGRLMCAGKVNEADWSIISIEEDLLSGALSAIMSLLSEVTDTNTPLRSINAGETIIQMEWSPFVIGALITDRESGAFTQGLKKAIERIITHYDADLIEWDGFSLDFLSVVPRIVNDIFLPLLDED